jgi:DNA/RNA-binding domain of Phe-tRNA-synthetase-like protein
MPKHHIWHVRPDGEKFWVWKNTRSAQHLLATMRADPNLIPALEAIARRARQGQNLASHLG